MSPTSDHTKNLGQNQTSQTDSFRHKWWMTERKTARWEVSCSIMFLRRSFLHCLSTALPMLSSFIQNRAWVCLWLLPHLMFARLTPERLLLSQSWIAFIFHPGLPSPYYYRSCPSLAHREGRDWGKTPLDLLFGSAIWRLVPPYKYIYLLRRLVDLCVTLATF